MGAPISHTSSGEWQSFEGRMRRRRAERCILRAEVAAEAGALAEARAALEEARKLAPGLAEIAAVEANIFGRETTIVAGPARPSARLLYYAAAVLACVAILSMGFVWWQRTSAVTPASPPAKVRQHVPGPSAAATGSLLPRRSSDVRLETVPIRVASINEPPIETKPVSAILEARAESEPPEAPISVPETLREPATVPGGGSAAQRSADREAARREPVAAVETAVAAIRDIAPVQDLALASTSTALAAAAPLPAR
jgi:hypothetical protein